MTSGELIIDIIKVGVVTIVTSKVTKAIGQKDNSEIIYASGITVCGVDIVLLIKPLINGIQEFNDKIGETIDGISGIIDKIKVVWGK